MRRSLGLPVLQTIAVIVIPWAPWSPQTDKFDIVLRDGREIRGWSMLPGPDQNTLAWAQGINHPALLAAIRIDHASEKFQQLPELNLHPLVATKGTEEKSSRLIGLYRRGADKKVSDRQFNDHRFAGGVCSNGNLVYRTFSLRSGAPRDLPGCGMERASRCTCAKWGPSS